MDFNINYGTVMSLFIITNITFLISFFSNNRVIASLFLAEVIMLAIYSWLYIFNIAYISHGVSGVINIILFLGFIALWHRLYETVIMD